MTDRPEVSACAGETLHVLERIIVAPAIGVFHRLDHTTVARGDVVGTVRSLGTATAIQSPFDGVLVGFLALEGERVRQGQPVAWLRSGPRSKLETLRSDDAGGQARRPR